MQFTGTLKVREHPFFNRNLITVSKGTTYNLCRNENLSSYCGLKVAEQVKCLFSKKRVDNLTNCFCCISIQFVYSLKYLVVVKFTVAILLLTE